LKEHTMRRAKIAMKCWSFWWAVSVLVCAVLALHR